MKVSQILILVALALIIGVPFALRPDTAVDDAAEMPTLVVITPHVPQIRSEFAEAFRAWHEEHHGGPARLDFRVPGGTSEIVKQLQSQYGAAIRAGLISADGTCERGTVAFDVVFGGGSFDHGRLKKGDGVTAEVRRADGNQEIVNVPMSVPAGFTQEQLDDWFGENSIGTQTLYDPEQYWIGTALSGFGIVYNRDVLGRLGLNEPESFSDLADPRLIGFVALADPRQSGSLTTTFDAILNHYGWEDGWRLLREITANARYFTNSSTKPPVDVAQGEAAAALAIDFYGRGQAQAILKPGERPEECRVGYRDPVGAVYIDADPISVLRGGPNPELARRFIEFVLTDKGQSLWQFPARAEGASAAELGPRQHELRRMPVRRAMYDRYTDRMIDRENPFAAASKDVVKGWRAGIPVMMGAFAIEVADEQRAAWRALNTERARVASGAASGVRLAEMEAMFYSWPETVVEGRSLAFTPDNFKLIREAWRPPGAQGRFEVQYTSFFRDAYRKIIRLADSE
mgnify:CR=1 FL=1